MNLKNLNKIIEKEPAFRKKQIEKLIYQDAIDNWDKATVLSLKLREELKKETSLEIKAEIFESKETKKALITLEDNYQIETVLMKHDDRTTVCVSSQVGCALGCKFCATGKLGLKRNLEVEEILEQVLVFKRKEKVNSWSSKVSSSFSACVRENTPLLNNDFLTYSQAREKLMSGFCGSS